MKLDDSHIKAALGRMNGSLPDGWQQEVVRRMRRRRILRRWCVGASTAAAVAAIVLPMLFVGNGPEYIYSDSYYASLPAVRTSIPEQIDEILGETSDCNQHYFELYEPLPQ